MVTYINVRGVRYKLDASAISCVRYRSRYGQSPISALLDDEIKLGDLVRITHCMIVGERPGLEEFALSVRNEPDFYHSAMDAVSALLSHDRRYIVRDQSDSADEFDEFDLLAGMACARMDFSILYELPILQIVAILNRVSDAHDPDAPKKYRQMTTQEMRTLYP